MIDPATGLFEVVYILNGSSLEASQLFDMHWLCRYPHPHKIVCDQGSEFKELLLSYGIEHAVSTRKNPQSNAIVERIHSIILNMLQNFELNNYI